MTRGAYRERLMRLCEQSGSTRDLFLAVHATGSSMRAPGGGSHALAIRWSGALPRSAVLCAPYHAVRHC